MVVLPLPGGPQRITDIGAPPPTSCRSGAPGAEQVVLPDQLVDARRAHPHRQRRVAADGGEAVDADGPAGGAGRPGGFTEGEEGVGLHHEDSTGPGPRRRNRAADRAR